MRARWMPIWRAYTSHSGDGGSPRNIPMKRLASPLLAFAAGTAVLLGSHPALAHGNAAVGLIGGVTHPLLGLDHLLMLVAVGGAAALISMQLVVWALAGAMVGAAIGSSGISVGTAEVLAALSISAVASMTLLATRISAASQRALLNRLACTVVAAGVGMHALLHGLEAPQGSNAMLWWGGALFSSALVCGSTYLLLKRLPLLWGQVCAAVLLLLGTGLALAPLALATGNAAAAA